MNSSSNGYGFRAAISAVFAAAIVGTSGLALDKAHVASLPKGTIEVGELTQLTPVDVLPQVAALPEVIVSAKRPAMTDRRERA
jgi:hypothetical protein